MYEVKIQFKAWDKADVVVIINWVVIEKLTFEPSLPRREEVSHVGFWGKNLPS